MHLKNKPSFHFSVENWLTQEKEKIEERKHLRKAVSEETLQKPHRRRKGRKLCNIFQQWKRKPAVKKRTFQFSRPPNHLSVPVYILHSFENLIINFQSIEIFNGFHCYVYQCTRFSILVKSHSLCRVCM